MNKLDAIKAKIVITEEKLALAKTAGDKDLIIVYENDLTAYTNNLTVSDHLSSSHFTAGHILPDISINLAKGKVMDAIGVAIEISPYEFSVLVSGVFLVFGTFYIKAFVPWRHRM